MRQKAKFIDYFKFFLLSVFVAFVVTVFAGLLMGYKYILVNGWSSRQEIPYQSFILVYKCQKSDLYVNDFATTSKNGKGSYITHQVIGISYDGYFTSGDPYQWEMNGETYHAYYGYQAGTNQTDITTSNGPIPDESTQAQEKTNMTKTPEDQLKQDCNVITMQFTEDWNATKEYINFETEFVGKVVWHNYTLGRTMFILKDPSFRNRVLLLGLISSVVIVFVMASQSKLHIGFFD